MPHFALRLLHGCWPAVLGWSLVQVLQRAVGRAASSDGVLTLVCGILAAYSLDRAREGPPPRSPTARLLRIVGAAATVACGAFALRLPWSTALVVPTLGAVALLYARWKRHLFTKLVLLPAVWLVAVVALPFADRGAFEWRLLLPPNGTAAVLLAVFLLVAAGCYLCDLKDEHADRSAGVASLPVRVGGAATARISAVMAAVAALLAALVGEFELALGAGLLVVAAQHRERIAAPVLGPLLVDAVLSLPGLLIAARAALANAAA